MKIYNRISNSSIPIILIFTMLFFSVSCVETDNTEIEEEGEEEAEAEVVETTTHDALIMTGAGARLNQLIALTEQLDNTGKLDNLEFISGASSGAINAIMINLVKDETNDYGWDDYVSTVLSLSNSDVFTAPGNSIPVDTTPLESLLTRVIETEQGYVSFSDLPYNTSIASTNEDTSSLAFSSNVTDIDTIGGDLVESIMASAAFPYVFPTVDINEITYSDGGFSEFIPTAAAIEYESLTETEFDNIYIVSFQDNGSVDLDAELDLLGFTGFTKEFYVSLLESYIESIGGILDSGLINGLYDLQTEYPDFASRCYVYTPDIDDISYYPLFDFNSATVTESYNLVHDWSLENEPILLADYLAAYEAELESESEDDDVDDTTDATTSSKSRVTGSNNYYIDFSIINEYDINEQ